MTTVAARRILAWLAAALLAAGCATQHPAYLKGQALLAEGQWEQGIAQIELASKEDDRNFEYRAALIDSRIRAANELTRQAGLLRDTGRFSEAESLYRRALRIQPEESRALAGLQQTAAERRRTALLKEAEAALGKKDVRTAERNVRTILTEAPRHPRALALLKRIEELRPRAGAAPTVLSAVMRKPITLQFRDANLRMIFDAISREAGINFVLDRDIPPAARATILVRNTPIEDAVESLIVTNALAKKVVSESHVLIYPNTPQKVREYQDLLIRNFYLQSAEAKQMFTLLRTILKSQNIFIDERRNLLVMRDTPEAIRLAERLIAAHDQVEPEVMLEVEILEVSRSKDTDIGIRFPDQIGFGVIADPTTVQSLRDLNASGIGVSGLDSAVTLNLKKLFNNVNLLANPRIRVRNREKAKIHVGDRVPVISTSLSTTAALSSQQVTYLEVGIKLEVEPQVLDDEVVIKVGLEVSSLGAQEKVENAIAYRVGTRNASTTLTLKDGETQILAGLITDSEREAVNKLPGLGELPLVGRLFSSNASQAEKTEIMLSITPRILRRLERPSAELAEFPSGPETNLRSAVTPAPAFKPAVRPAPGAVRGGVFPARPPVTPTPSAPVPGAAPTPAAPAAPAPALPPTIIFQPPPGVGR
ncbi:MAG: general secretion pathway protein GspD [Betaproteobacteria bacterium]|nr:general secretion pathway protein GspD [Betaproteobacteria bacterium]